MNAALTLAGIQVRLGGQDVLRGLERELLPGQIRALVGLNGAGKTTALRVALGMLRPDAGRVLLQGATSGQVRPTSGALSGIWWKRRLPIPN